jgi:ABC-type transport system substrate-binding protein
MLRKAVLVAGLLRAFGSISFSFAAYVLRAEGGHRQAKAVGLQLCTMLLIALNCVALAADPNKTLHIATQDINTLDPQQANEAYSFRVVEAIYENLYELDYLSQPAKLVPNTAVALPEIADGGLTWTIRVRPGIYFTNDPAFKGRPRELVAEDYVYSVKRLLDPALRLGGDALMTDLIVDARDAVAAATKSGARFDYDRPLKGIQALDRYSWPDRRHSRDAPGTASALQASRCRDTLPARADRRESRRECLRR